MDKYIDNEINNIKDKYNYGYNLNQLLNIYNDMKEINNKNDEIEIIYKPKDKGKVRIFGFTFVKNNKGKCKIIYNNKEYELTEYFNSIDNNIKKEIKIKLKGINNIIDMSYMFQNCKSLSSLPDISKLDTSNVINMRCMFDFCSSLSSLPDISKWNTSNVTDMKCMFYNCQSLISLPDISKWNTSNVADMRSMFRYCKESLNIPSKFQK